MSRTGRSGQAPPGWVCTSDDGFSSLPVPPHDEHQPGGLKVHPSPPHKTVQAPFMPAMPCDALAAGLLTRFSELGSLSGSMKKWAARTFDISTIERGSGIARENLVNADHICGARRDEGRLRCQRLAGYNSVSICMMISHN